MFFSVFIEIVLLSLFFPYLFIDFIVPILVIVANFINKPIEQFIKNKYIKKATNKINKISCLKIAITGSYGKTSVKNYISDVLRKKYIVMFSPKSYNTPLGISKFINTTNFLYTDFMISEFGARRSGDIKELASYFDYDISIVTSIGEMHIDTFKTVDTIVKEKMSIIKKYDKSHIAILNYENDLIRNYIVDCIKYTYGFNCGKYQAKNIVLSIFDSKFDLFVDNIFVRSFVVKVLGRSAILNLLPAIILCHLYDVDFKYIDDVLMVDNRLSLRIMNNYYILDDAYNSNILGATYALEVLRSFEGDKYLITPGFVEMDLIKEELAIKYADEISKSVDQLILVKNDFTKLLSKYLDNVSICFVDSFKEGFNLFLKVKTNNSIVLIENDLLE